MKSIKSICSECQECCKKYGITLLPKEAEKIAKKLNLSEKKFIQKHCDLMLQFFPSKNQKNYFIINKKEIPEKIRKKLKEKNSSNYFFVLPNISLKKNSKCIFLEKGLCKIHSVKPEQCQLFPFISLKKETSFWKKYPFCELMKQEIKPEKNFMEKSGKHYEKVKEYYEKIKKAGFQSVWKNLPEKGNVFFEDEKLSKITKNEFLKLIETFK